jgi:tight adherence protein C
MGGGDGMMWLAFLGVTSLVLLIALLISSRHRRLEERLEDLGGKDGVRPNKGEMVNQFTKSTLPKLGAPLLPRDEKERTLLTTRLVHAGLYSRQSLAVFLGVKMLLVLALPLLGVVAGLLNLLPMFTGLAFGAIAGGFGLVGPSFWLDYRKNKRQTTLRRSLPDALDVIIICLEGGLSLPASLNRVVSELRLAHPLLGAEMSIVQREIQMGCSTGEAIRLFGQRCDLEEVRSLAAVILQTEKYGASLTKALRVHADSLRIKRMQRAEELAQKAVIKVLIPTILFIFPALFLVILGPAAIQVMDLLRSMRGGAGITLPATGGR